jgi:hypothetical protein
MTRLRITRRTRRLLSVTWGGGDLTVAEWERLRPLLPVSNGRCRRWRRENEGEPSRFRTIRGGVGLADVCVVGWSVKVMLLFDLRAADGQSVSLPILGRWRMQGTHAYAGGDLRLSRALRGVVVLTPLPWTAAQAAAGDRGITSKPDPPEIDSYPTPVDVAFLPSATGQQRRTVACLR